MPFWKNYHTRIKLALLLVLCWQLYQSIQHYQKEKTNFGCEICSDKAGYYIYLPIWFDYGLDSAALPDTLRSKAHESFHNDLAPGKTFSKFTGGVAMMLAPYYVLAKTWYTYFDRKDPLPISNEYLAFTNFGLALYLTLAFLALFLLLRKRFGDGTALITLLLLYFGTNLIYYVQDESLMSHAYSFCLFIYAWFFLERGLERKQKVSILLFALFAAWAIVVRPTNALGVLTLLVLGIEKKTWKEQVAYLIRNTPLMIGIALLVFSPQLLYWKQTTRHWIVYSYQGEGFIYWNKPALLEQWFSVKSGILPYNPLIILLPLGLFLLLIKKSKEAWILIPSFVVAAYLFASWGSIGFGDCNFGYRPFVEFLALWSIGFAALVQRMLKVGGIGSLLFFLFCALAIGYSSYLKGEFDTCFFGDYWDYAIFVRDYFS